MSHVFDESRASGERTETAGAASDNADLAGHVDEAVGVRLARGRVGGDRRLSRRRIEREMGKELGDTRVCGHFVSGRGGCVGARFSRTPGATFETSTGLTLPELIEYNFIFDGN